MKGNDKTILICSNYAWTIYNFRMSLIKRLKKEGYKVVVLTQFDGYESIVAKQVDLIKPLFISRKGINPFIDFLTILDLIRNFIILKPSLLLLFTIKPVIYGSIASKFVKVKAIVMITGLGTAFISDNWITKVVKSMYRFALSSVSVVFFQNVDDKNLFLNNKLIISKSCRLTPGSGVDLDKFLMTHLPVKNDMIFILIGRMLRDKGVREFVDAARKIKLKYTNVRFQLLGPLGVENRTAISNQEIDDWQKEGIIKYMGETDDVIPFIRNASCVVLPSYREGTSRVLLEAAAMGRPIITTNVTGCREIVEHGSNGFLCNPRDYLDLSNKIELMLKTPYQSRKIMGINGRKKIENEFNQDIVCDLYIDAIEN